MDRYAAGQAGAEESRQLENWTTFGRHGETPGEKVIMRHMESLDQRLGIKTRSRKLWPTIAAIAASVILVLTILFYHDTKKPVQTTTVHNSQNPILPGKSGATLTLATGSTIALDGTKKSLSVGERLRYEDGSSVQVENLQNPQSIHQLTVATAKGQLYAFILSDGTKVFLNASSSLVFPSRFSGKDRRVQITGEAYFEVAKDKAHPFVVQTMDQSGKGLQSVEVLGTHFNINAYGDNGQIRTTLAEGSVKVTASGHELILKPEQQAIYNPARDRLVPKPADLSGVLAWRSGKFAFSGARIDEVMSELSRWYDVEVSYEGKIPGSTFSGTISKDLTAQEMLELIHFAGARFRIEGRKIVVTGS